MTRLTEEQAAVLTAYTGILCGPIPNFHAYAEALLERPVLTSEFGDREVMAEIKEAARADFIALVAL